MEGPNGVIFLQSIVEYAQIQSQNETDVHVIYISSYIHMHEIGTCTCRHAFIVTRYLTLSPGEME